MDRILACYSTPSALLRRQLDTSRWMEDIVDDLFAVPRMEIWPSSRLHRNFFDRQMLSMQQEMNRMLDWTDQRLQSLVNENADQQLKVIEDGESEFRLNLGCSKFKPEEVQCKINGHYLTVEGKQEHEDKDTGSKSIRQFSRSVLLPENAELDKVNCTFKQDGVLSIRIPKKQLAVEDKKNDKVIPIQREQ